MTAFNKKKLPLHLLANNAAVWMVEDQMTEDGFEVKGLHVLHAFNAACHEPRQLKGHPAFVPDGMMIFCAVCAYVLNLCMSLPQNLLLPELCATV